jgi:hypothetical protein
MEETEKENEKKRVEKTERKREIAMRNERERAYLKMQREEARMNPHTDQDERLLKFISKPIS